MPQSTMPPSTPNLPRQPGWRTRDVIRTATLLIAVYGAARLLLFAHRLVFVAFLGVLFGLAVSAGVDWLQRWHFPLPRGITAGIIVVSAIAVLVGFGAWTGPTIRSQSAELKERLPIAFAKLDRWIGEREGGVLGEILAP